MPIDEVAEDKIADEHSGEQDELEYQEHQQRGSVLDEVVARTVDGIPYYYAELPHQHVLHRLHAQVVLPQSVVLPEKLMRMLMMAEMTKNTLTRGLRIRKIADMLTFISIIYLSNGKSLLPTHPSKYLYPSAYSFLLKINDRMLNTDRRVFNVYAIDYIPLTMKGEMALRL